MLDRIGVYKRYRLPGISVKLVTGLLCVCIGLINAPVAYAGFSSDGKRTFSASVTMPSFIDSNYDGVPDWWYQEYRDQLAENDPRRPYFDPTSPDSTDYDADDDGLTNLEEYRNDTNPIVSESGIVASITVERLNDTQPLDVRLTAGYSYKVGYDPHPIVKYEWDFDGNGTYDYTSRSPSVVYKFTTAGENNVRLRVTNIVGRAGVAADTINVPRADGSPDAEVNGWDFIDKLIIVPSKGILRGWDISGNSIVRYQWDTTGNGEYDFTSKKSGVVTKSFDETRSQSFHAHFKATTDKGLSDIGAVFINIDANNWYDTADWENRPKAILSCGKVINDKNAGEKIVFRGYGIPAGYSSGREKELVYIRKLEWDFESDGIYDYAIEKNNPDWKKWNGEPEVPHVYGTPGIYRATLRVTTDLEADPPPPKGINVNATDHVLVIVGDSGQIPPTAVAKVKYKGKYVEQINTTLPFNAQFKHSDSEDGSSSIVKYEWDFDGDKKIDYVTTPAKKGKKPKYHYRLPGYYMASLTVTDENGLTDTDYIPVFVSTKPDIYASAITTPEERQTIAGNNVTLTCDVFPDDVTANDITFWYREDIDGSEWINIEGEVKEITSYMTTWDTTGLYGDYKLRAIVNGDVTDTDGDRYEIIDVRVDTVSPDIYEDNSIGYTKKVKIDSDKSNSIILYNGTRIDIPIGTIDGDETITITENGGFSAGVGNAIDIEVDGESYTFSKDITITMPYSDGDLGGRDENDLVILWNNNGTWEPLYDSVVYPDENFVSAKINHFSTLGAGFITWGAVLGAGGAAIGEGAVSYCFIATAAYSSSDAGDVMILREFRDRFLLTNPLGRRFVDSYYKYSPSVAEYIKDKPALKKITRLALKPLVKFARWKLNESRSRSIRGEEDAE